MSSDTLPPTTRAVRVLALAAAFALAFTLLPPLTARAQDVTPARVEGETRFHTAANIATLTFQQADVAHIAFAEDFPDALAASFAAGSVNGPVLLSATNTVPDPTWSALADLDVERVVLVGGTAVLSQQVAAALASEGYEVDRIDGVNRYQTASAVAMRYGTQTGVGEIEGNRTAILASGATFADALAAGPIAAGLRLPLFLTPPDRTEVSVNTSLQQLDIERVVVIGGTGAVSSSVVEYYQDQGYEVERWGGATRTDTARIVADQALARLGFTADLTLLARGDDFPDALTASIHGGVNRAPLLLSATPGTVSQHTVGWLRAACPHVNAVRAIGGTAAITQQALSDAETAAEDCQDAPQTQQTYGVAPMEPVTEEPGGTHDISVFVGGGDPRPIEFALFRCAVADPVNAPPHTFADSDGDGHADGIGTTDAQVASITTVDGEMQPPGTRHVSDLDPGADGVIEFRLDSSEPDCTVPAAFHDANGNRELDVDGDGRPLEPFGYGQYDWSE